jgi:hypothetical protein
MTGATMTSKALNDISLRKEITITNKSVIITPSDSKIAQAAAEELKYFIKKATDNELKIFTEKNFIDNGNIVKIYIGDTRASRKLGIECSRFSPDAYLIRTHDRSIFLAGKDENIQAFPYKNKNYRDFFNNFSGSVGSLFAVYDFAETYLNIRFLWPGKTGEFIPHIKKLTISPVNRQTMSQFRFITSSLMMTSKDYEQVLWCRRAMRASTANTKGIRPGHRFGKKWRSKYSKTHPKWFALVKKINNPKWYFKDNNNWRFLYSICPSNKELQKHLVDDWQKKECKTAINCCETDNYGSCECKVCLDWDGADERGPTARYANNKNVSNRYAKFYKAVYQLATKFNPNVEIIAFAYKNYIYPPTIQLNKNIIIGFVPDIPFPRTIEYQEWVKRQWKGWIASGASVYLRPNYFLGGYVMPENWAKQFADEFKFEFENGLLGISIDGPVGCWGVHCINYFVMAQLCVHPEKSVESILNDFYSCFGNAKSEIKKFFEYWENYTSRNAKYFNEIYEHKLGWYKHGFLYPQVAHLLFPESCFSRAEKILSQALKKSKGDKKTQIKIKFIQKGLEHAKLCSQVCKIIAENQENNPLKCLEAIKRLKTFRNDLPDYIINRKFIEQRYEKLSWGNDFTTSKEVLVK